MSNFFSIPDKEKNYQAYMLFAISMIWSVVIGCIVSVGFLYFPELWPRWLTFLCIAISIALITQYFNRKGYSRQFSWIFIVLLWSFITIPCLSAGGIEAPGIISQVSVILTAGFLLGWKGGLLLGLLSMFTDLGFAFMAIYGVLPEPTVHHTPISRWIGAIIPFGTVIVLQYYATQHLRYSLEKLKNEVIKREEAEKSKDKALYDMKERVKELETLYKVSQILQTDKQSMESIFIDIVNVIPGGWQYPEITAARLCINEQEYRTDNFLMNDDMLSAELKTNTGTKVRIDVVYLKERAEIDEGPFLKEERSLINTLVEILKTDIERREHLEELNDYKYAIDIASMVCITKVDGTFTYVNDNFIRSSKFERDELIGQNFKVLISEFHQQEYLDALRLQLDEGQNFRGEFCNKAKDETLYWVDSTIVPFVNEKGEVYQYLSLNYDITLKKEAMDKISESEQLLRKITSQLPGNTYMFEIKEGGLFDVLFMNRGNEKFNHELTPEILMEQPEKLLEIVHEDDKNKFSNAFSEAHAKKSSIDVQYRIHVKETLRWRWMQATPDPIENGRTLWYGATSDITPLVEYISSIEQIIFDIAHVLRRPIVNIIGLTQLLLQQDYERGELQKIYKMLNLASNEMDSFTVELNKVYNEMRQNNDFNIEVSSNIDKRISLFKYNV